MRIGRFAIFSLFFILTALLLIGPATAQENSTGDSNEEEPALLQPNYLNSDYGFGMVIPADFSPYGHDEDNVWVLEVTPATVDQASARLSIEDLPDNVTDVAGVWQLMKDLDPAMAHNITYEKIASVAGTGAIQARIEKLEGARYMLIIMWVWVNDGRSFTLSSYPPEGGDNNLARDLAKQLVDQFRWMTPEEIEAAQESLPPAPSGPPLPPSQEF
jgi:hypothetical protein